MCLQLIVVRLGGSLGLDDLDGGVVANVLGHGLDSALSRVLRRVGLVVGRVEEESREALDLGRGVVGGGIDLGDDNRVDVGELSSQLLPLGGKGLAVATPRGVEFNEDILGVVHDDLIEVLADEDGDRTVVVLGDILRLDMGDGGSVLPRGSEGGDLVLGELTLIDDVVLASGAVLDAEGGELARETEVLGVVVPSVSIQKDEGELALEGGGGSSGGSLDLIDGVGAGVDKQPDERQTAVDVALEVIRSDLTEEREGLGLEEGGHGVLGVLTIEDNGVGTGNGALDLLGFGAGEDGERVVVTQGVGEGGKGGVQLRVITGGVSDDVETRSLGGPRLELGGVSEDGEGRLVLLLHEVDHGISGTGGRVVGRLASVVTEDLEGRESTDTVLGAKVLVLGTVDLHHGDVGTDKGIGSSLVFRSQTLAVSTPRGIELDQRDGVGGNLVIEVVLTENDDVGVTITCEREGNITREKSESLSTALHPYNGAKVHTRTTGFPPPRQQPINNQLYNDEKKTAHGLSRTASQTCSRQEWRVGVGGREARQKYRALRGQTKVKLDTQISTTHTSHEP